MKPLLFPNNVQFWYETLRSMSHIAYGGADFGEVVSTGERITEGDYDSWFVEWTATADRVSGEAEKALAAGHTRRAREASSLSAVVVRFHKRRRRYERLG
ncbi:hypothetical protein ABZZ01_32700, partial [Streptomyces virginiae]